MQIGREKMAEDISIQPTKEEETGAGGGGRTAENGEEMGKEVGGKN